MAFNTPRHLRIQSILYNTDRDSLRRSYSCIVNSIDYAIRRGVIDCAHIAYGDCSPSPLLSDEITQQWIAEEGDLASVPISYTFFDKNRGSASGHNALMMSDFGMQGSTSGDSYLVFMNPDVKMMADTIHELAMTMRRPSVGLVEARQLPIEHPKAYDEVTGHTLWASTATAITTTEIFREVGGFDESNFFL